MRQQIASPLCRVPAHVGEPRGSQKYCSVFDLPVLEQLLGAIAGFTPAIGEAALGRDPEIVGQV